LVKSQLYKKAKGALLICNIYDINDKINISKSVFKSKYDWTWCFGS
jgi:hypothetical protein